METSTLEVANTQEAPAVTYRCEHCLSYEKKDPPHLFVIAWSKEWAKLGVIDRFHLYHKPCDHPLSFGLETQPCFDNRATHWSNLDEVIERPQEFLEVLQQSSIRITKRAAADLLPYVSSTYFAGPESTTFTHAEVLRQQINGDCGDLAPVKWTR